MTDWRVKGVAEDQARTEPQLFTVRDPVRFWGSPGLTLPGDSMPVGPLR